MIIVITRKTYDAVIAINRNGPLGHGDALLTPDFATVRIPEELGRALAKVHPNAETAIRMLLEGTNDL